MSLPAYERLGVFYLGRSHDLDRRQTLPEPLLFESKNLVTHGLIVGMTGSGKTGLGVALLEEAALDGVPAVVVDPKGDLTNLLLTFPELRPEDFLPWINEDEARARNVSSAEYAAQQAALWKEGLARWDQDGDRIRRLRAGAEFAVYTPGSKAGLPLSLLESFAPPPAEVLEDGELLRERVTSTVQGLLGLAGIEADPFRSRESILLCQLLQSAWTSGRTLDLAGLILEVQQPPISRIGVLDLESFYPAKDRFELSIRLNNLLSAPTAAAWTEGDPLDFGRLLYTADGRPRIAVLSIAHLGDAERMFFVTSLLNQTLSWMRQQSGTGSLRALLYMDEIFGYFPPVANPPSKQPLLTLLKQARAFGLGVVLATQNPVDLDYKGLANIGTWFIGRLQTERDRERLLDGLEGAVVSRGEALDRADLGRVLASLGRRIFLWHSIGSGGDFELFESRWALAYLRGPLTRKQIQALADPARGRPDGGVPIESRPVSAGPTDKPPPGSISAANRARPVLPPEIPQFFAPPPVGFSEGDLVYRPRLLAVAQVRFDQAQLGVDRVEEVVLTVEITEQPIPVDWAAAEEWKGSLDQLEKEPVAAEFTVCAPAASQPRNYAVWGRDLTRWLQAHRKLRLFSAKSMGLISRPGEEEREFRIRVQQAARERRDEAAARLRQRYDTKLSALEERLRRAEAAREREAQQAARAKFDTFVSLGSTLLGALLGRRTVSAANVGRAATTMRRAGRAYEQSADVTRAAESVEAIGERIRELEVQLEAEVEALCPAWDPAAALEAIEVRPARGNVNVRHLGLLWVPFRQD